jgi:hypothetical protein
MGEVVELLVSWVVTTALTFVVVIWDERHLTGERLARAWPPTSRDAAIVAFGVLALPFHFARTRGHLGSALGVLGCVAGVALGAVAVVLVALVSSAALWALDRALSLAS